MEIDESKSSLVEHRYMYYLLAVQISWKTELAPIFWIFNLLCLPTVHCTTWHIMPTWAFSLCASKQWWMSSRVLSFSTSCHHLIPHSPQTSPAQSYPLESPSKLSLKTRVHIWRSLVYTTFEGTFECCAFQEQPYSLAFLFSAHLGVPLDGDQ